MVSIIHYGSIECKLETVFGSFVEIKRLDVNLVRGCPFCEKRCNFRHLFLCRKYSFTVMFSQVVQRRDYVVVRTQHVSSVSLFMNSCIFNITQYSLEKRMKVGWVCYCFVCGKRGWKLPFRLRDRSSFHRVR